MSQTQALDAQALRSALRGAVVLPGDDGYDAARGGLGCLAAV